MLTAIGLSPSGSSTVNIYTQTIHRTTQITTNLEECGPCPFFAPFNFYFFLDIADMSMKPKNFNNEIIDVASLKMHTRKLIHKKLSMAETYLLLTDATRMPYILL